MARLLVRTTDNKNLSDPSLDAMRAQPGNVVWVAEDDHVFSKAELSCGHYRVLDVPGIKAEDFQYLMVPVVDQNGDQIQRFAKALTLSSLAVSPTLTKTDIDAVAVDNVVSKQVAL